MARTGKTVTDKVEKVARQEAEEVRKVTVDAVKSGAYLYPLHGILYFASHKSLWRPLLSKLIPTLTTGTVVTIFMFLVTYVPQVAVLAFVDGPLAPISAVLLVLSESSTLLNAISRNFIIDEALLDTFDGTLVAKECESLLISGGREIKRGGGADAIGKLGKIVSKPFQRFTPTAIIKYFLYLPLNFIPVVGTVLFVTLQGKRFGPAAHERYFQLKKWSKSQRDEWVEEHRGAYTSFGVPATLLEMIPVVGIFFSFTNCVGAALWAANLERGGTTAPALREQAQKASKTQ